MRKRAFGQRLKVPVLQSSMEECASSISGFSIARARRQAHKIPRVLGIVILRCFDGFLSIDRDCNHRYNHERRKNNERSELGDRSLKLYC